MTRTAQEAAQGTAQMAQMTRTAQTTQTMRATRATRAARTAEERALDDELANFIQARIHDIAQLMIARHDENAPSSSLSTLPKEERINWINLESLYLIRSIRDDVPQARLCAYRPSATLFAQVSVRAIADTVNFFDSAQEVEAVVCIFLQEAYAHDLKRYLALTARLRHHCARQLKAQVASNDEYFHQLEEQLRRGISQTLKTQLIQALQRALMPSLLALKIKAAQAHGILDAVGSGNTLDAVGSGEMSLSGGSEEILLMGDGCEAAVLLSEIKLLTSDMLELIVSCDELFGDEMDSQALPSGLSLSASEPNSEPEFELESKPKPTSAPVRKRESASAPDQSPNSAPKLGKGRAIHFTERERDIIILLAQGQTNAEIAAELHLSELTVKGYVGSILDKTQLDNRTQLAVFAVTHGLL